MSSIIYYLGDVRDRLLEIPDDSVDLFVTSPPFLSLRSYLPPDHPDKALEIGTEPTPAAFIDTLLGLTAEWRRILAPHGSICVELGDTYSGSGGGGGDYLPGGLREGQPGFGGSAERQRAGNAAHWRAKNSEPDAWPMTKSKCMVPEAYRLALAYGINPLTGAASPAGQWRIRNSISWCRPNPSVGELGDKFRPATSDMVVACVGDRRYFDFDAVREPHKDENDAMRERRKVKGSSRDDGYQRPADGISSNPGGAPPHDFWVIATAPYKGSHYATFPPELIRRPVQAMCPERVCRTCGTPSSRIAGDEWTDCGHDDWRPGLILDPFGGVGTTGVVATCFDRDAILIDLDAENLGLTRRRFTERSPFDKAAVLHTDEEVELDKGVVRFDVSVRGKSEVANIRSGQLGLLE